MTLEQIIRRFSVVYNAMEFVGLTKTECVASKSIIYPIPKHTTASDEKAHIMALCTQYGIAVVTQELTNEISRCVPMLIERRDTMAAELTGTRGGSLSSSNTSLSTPEQILQNALVTPLTQLSMDLRRLHQLSTQRRRILVKIGQREAAWAKVVGMLSVPSGGSSAVIREATNTVQRLSVEIVDDITNWTQSGHDPQLFRHKGMGYIEYMHHSSVDLKGNRLAYKCFSKACLATPFLVDVALLRKHTQSSRPTKDMMNAQRTLRAIDMFEQLLSVSLNVMNSGEGGRGGGWAADGSRLLLSSISAVPSVGLPRIGGLDDPLPPVGTGTAAQQRINVQLPSVPKDDAVAGVQVLTSVLDDSGSSISHLSHEHSGMNLDDIVLLDDDQQQGGYGATSNSTTNTQQQMRTPDVHFALASIASPSSLQSRLPHGFDVNSSQASIQLPSTTSFIVGKNRSPPLGATPTPVAMQGTSSPTPTALDMIVIGDSAGDIVNTVENSKTFTSSPTRTASRSPDVLLRKVAIVVRAFRGLVARRQVERYRTSASLNAYHCSRQKDHYFPFSPWTSAPTAAKGEILIDSHTITDKVFVQQQQVRRKLSAFIRGLDLSRAADAAITIQKCWKIYRIRKSVREPVAAAVWYRKRRRAVRTIEYHWRNTLKRRCSLHFETVVRLGGRVLAATTTRENLGKFHNKIVTLQSVCQGAVSALVVYRTVLQYRQSLQTRSASMIQRLVRTYFSRRQYCRLFRRRVRTQYSQAIHDLHRVSVRIIQAWWRGTQHRMSKSHALYTANRVNVDPRRHAAATRIQAAWKGHVARTTTIPQQTQLNTKCRESAAIIERKISAAIRIQTMFRRVRGKRLAVQRHKAREREKMMKVPNAAQRYRMLHFDAKTVEGMCEEHLKTITRRIGDGRKCK
eukprot:PhF_6_TR37477/c0_g1_i12/m.55220